MVRALHLGYVQRGIGLAVAALSLVACPEATRPNGAILFTRTRPPDKPGQSLKSTMMCSCLRCEPQSCCRELEQERPENDEKCAKGYDFSACKGIAVTSCESRCFEHRWRASAEKGCQEKRPPECCHDA